MLAHFERPENSLTLVAVDCPVPMETSHGTFDTPEALTRHLLEAHEPWETAQLAAKLSIHANALEAFASEETSNVAEALAESWFPTAHTEPDGYGDQGGALIGLERLPLQENS